jgi:hypothetical protein
MRGGFSRVPLNCLEIDRDIFHSPATLLVAVPPCGDARLPGVLVPAEDTVSVPDRFNSFKRQQNALSGTGLLHPRAWWRGPANGAHGFPFSRRGASYEFLRCPA